MEHGGARASILGAIVALALACASAPPPREAPHCPAPGRRPDASWPGAVGDPGRGERLFGDACQGCHASTAALRRPDGPPAAPRLDCPAWLAQASDGYLYDAINRGPGLFGHAGEPPLGERLAPADVADLVAYLRSLGDR